MGLRFIWEFLNHPIEVGTLTQSSRYLANEIAKRVQGKDVVEFGAGIGAITRKILEYLPEDGELICIEKNNKFCRYLEDIAKTDSRLKVINDKAENLEKYVNSEEIDCIVSSLPLALRRKTRKRIFELANKSGKYIQLQYFKSGKFAEYFAVVKQNHVWINVPPAFIYECSNNLKNF